MDFDTAYLGSSITKDLHRQYPSDVAQPNRVPKLHEALYGSKQLGREWYEFPGDTLTLMGFRQVQLNLYIFAWYMDDTLTVGKETISNHSKLQPRHTSMHRHQSSKISPRFRNQHHRHEYFHQLIGSRQPEHRKS